MAFSLNTKSNADSGGIGGDFVYNRPPKGVDKNIVIIALVVVAFVTYKIIKKK